jgi:tRNA nucleotidyltransferase (CCA-adding enzyme)
MNKIIFEVLDKLENNGYEAYIIGGFVRDLLMNIDSMDIDICTNALPKDVKEIFDINCESNEYGSINFKTGGYNFDITTFRKEKKYENRKPTEVEYINNLEEDVKRRDFTINSICLDKNSKLIDLLNGKSDINNKIIRLIGDNSRLQEDPLRILRAIRFASLLDFNIDPKLSDGIIMHKELLKDLSDMRIKNELDKILINKNFKKGLQLLKKYNLLDLLGISINDDIVYTADLCGMWSQINIKRNFPFTKEEKQNITKIREILSNKVIDNYTIYKYGLYISSVAAKILKYNQNDIVQMHDDLPIHLEKELNISFLEIKELIQDDGFDKTKEVEEIIIKKVLNHNLNNEHDEIVKFIKQGMIL